MSAPAPPAPVTPAAFQEAYHAPGHARPHWQVLMALLDRLGCQEMSARSEESRRLLADHGVSCPVNGHGGNQETIWQLDLLPLVMSAEEWKGLEAGLLQRARLLNLLLADLYGQQRLLRSGLVPAPLIFANPGYLRACQAMAVPGGVHLQIYAADLARSPSGEWRVVGDGTQAPAGLGFALENRSILSRVMPEAIRELQPRPISDVLRVRREALRHYAPPEAKNSSIVLLTPGPRHETYFEHAYLARWLGLSLVEGGDLTVRDRRLFVKTLAGLRPAGVLVRQVRDADCDPLELGGDSLLGTAGLIEAARAGNLRIANALGSGLLECPAFCPFLPHLCRHLLGEELRLPSVATWWCGEGPEQAYVRDHLDELVIRPALSPPNNGLTPRSLSQAQRADLLERLRLHPHQYVGQEWAHWSQAPVWVDSHPVSRPFVLRVFVLHDGRDFMVMAGGLARVAGEDRIPCGGLSLTGLNKDVWILPSEEAPGDATHLITPPLTALERSPSDLPSRAGDNFLWLGRYTERLEQTVRLSRSVVGCLSDQTSAANQRRIGTLQRVLARLGLIPPPLGREENREGLQAEVLQLLLAENRPSGVRDLLQRIHQAAFAVRDRLSSDTWRILHRLEPDAQARPSQFPLGQASVTLRNLVLDLAAFSGLAMENMTRGQGWTFLDMGRRIERGMFMAELMEAFLRDGTELDLWLQPALEIADSVMTHRRRYLAETSLRSVLEVLVLDEANPRSPAFQIGALEHHAATLPLGASANGVAAIKSCIGHLHTQLDQLREEWAIDSSNPDLPLRQAGSLADLAGGLSRLSELLTQVYFNHITPQIN